MGGWRWYGDEEVRYEVWIGDISSEGWGFQHQWVTGLVGHGMAGGCMYPSTI